MTRKISLFGLQIDAVRMSDAVSQVFDWVRTRDGHCHYVVTPNVDHAVMFQEHAGLRTAYQHAGMVLADGAPVVLASRLLRRGLPERVAGSDLVPALFAAAADHGGLKVYLLGAAPGVAERAALKIVEQYPTVQVVGTYSPPLGFEKDTAENAAIVQRISGAGADVLLVGLGAPKQELWVHAHFQNLQVPVALCIGATIDFIAGQTARAPKWMRKTGLEWLHRLVSEPKRLVRRYARDAWVFPQLVWREALGAKH